MIFILNLLIKNSVLLALLSTCFSRMTFFSDITRVEKYKLLSAKGLVYKLYKNESTECNLLIGEESSEFGFDFKNLKILGINKLKIIKIIKKFVCIFFP